MNNKHKNYDSVVCTYSREYKTWKLFQSWLYFKRIYFYNAFMQPLAVFLLFTGKYLSEALILASTNPQYDNRLFIELWVQYMKTTSSEHVFMYWTRNSMNNLLSYSGLVDARISASEKDLPVQSCEIQSWKWFGPIFHLDIFLSFETVCNEIDK